MLRRGESAERTGSAAYRFAGWQLDPVRRELLSPDGFVVALSSGEFGLLMAFLQSPSRILSRDQLLDLARGRDADSFDRAIDVQVSRLRRKLADHGGGDLIVTVRNEGYMFAARPVLR